MTHGLAGIACWLGFLTAATLSAPRAMAVVAIPCAGATTEVTKAAVAASDEAFRQHWRDASPNWFTAFDVAPQKRNPFDKTELPTAEPIRGLAWAQGLFCMANLSPDGSEILVRYYARVTSFHEGQSWSKPNPEGLLQTLLVKRTGDTWQTRALTVEQQIFLPNATLRRPGTDEIPAADAKLGIPCSSASVWDGKTCVKARAQAETTTKK